MRPSLPLIRPLARPSEPRHAAAATAVAVTWTVVAFMALAGDGPAWLGDAAPAFVAVPPLALLTWFAVARGAIPRPWALAGWWMGLVALGIAGAALLEVLPLLALGVPTAIAAGWFVTRRPAAAVLITFFVTGTYGSLVAFLTFPTTSTVQLGLIGLWAALIGGALVGVRRPRVNAWPAMLGLALFLGVTLVQAVLDARTGADAQFTFDSLAFGAVLMTAVLVTGYSHWSAATYRRIVKGIVAIAAGVGAYAVLRWIIGPADSEALPASLSAYNYSGGKLKLLGSLPNGADLGVWTSTVIPFCAAAAVLVTGRWRLLAAAAVILLAIGMLGSQLRTGLPAALAGLGIAVVLYQSCRAFPGLHLGRTIGVIAVAIAAGAVAFAVTGGSSDPVRGYDNILRPGSDPSVQERLYKWDQAFDDLRDRPFGYGLGSATTGVRSQGVLPRFYTNVGSYSVDNGYLKVALEQGTAAMLLFIAGMLMLLGGLVRSTIGARDPLRAAIGIGAAGTLTSFLVLLTTNAFQEMLAAMAVWLIVGLGAAQFTRADPAPPRPALGPMPVGVM